MSPLDKTDLPPIPYPGIEPFTYAERQVFFARSAEARRLVRLIALYRGVLLYAASGVGKSSLVNAGLLPLIVEEGHHPERLRVQPRLGEEILVEPAASFPSVLTGDGGRGVLSTEAFLEASRAQAATARPLFVFDQFEEWVTLFQEVSAERREEVRRCRERVLELLVALVRDPALPVKVLIVLREDYLASLQPLFERCPTLPDNFLRLCPLDPGQLEGIIRGPFEKHPGCYKPEIESDLAETIASQLALRAGPEGVPLTEVQIVCRSLFEAGLRGEEPARVFAQTGGVRGMLERFLEGSLDALGPKLRAPATALLGRLITSAGTRNVISRDDLLERVAVEDEIPRERLAEALDGLEETTHLVRKELRREVYFYEIVSEFLVDWIRRQAERRRLARVQRANRRLRWSVAGLAAGLLVVALLAVAAWISRQAAERQKQLRISQILAEESGDALAESVPLALLLANESVRWARLAGAGGTERAEESLRWALARSPGHVLGSDDAPALEAALSPDGRWVATTGKRGTVSLWRLGSDDLEKPPIRLTGYGGNLTAVAVGPGGRRLAIAGGGPSLSLWDRDAPASPRVLTSKLDLETVLFSPDGRWLVAAGLADEPQVWRMLGEPATAATALRRPGCRPTRWSYGPLLRWIAVGCDDGAAVLWDLRGPELEQWDVPALPAEVSALAFDPDESRLAVGGLDGSVRIWRLDGNGPEEVSVDLVTEPGEVEALAFHPESEQLAAAFATGNPRLWRIGRLRSPSSEPVQAAWDPRAGLVWSGDGRWLVTRDPGGRSQLFSLGDDGGLTVVRELGEAIATFSPGSRWLATGDNQGRLRRLDLRQPAAGSAVFQAHEGPITALGFGAGDWALTRSPAGPARLWELGAEDPARGDEPLLLRAAGKALPAPPRPNAAADPTGTWWLTFRGDAPVLWNGRGSGASILLRRHEGGVTSWAWSADGRWLFTGARGGMARLWHLERLRELVRAKLPPEPVSFFEHRGRVTFGAFSPDGTWLVTLGGNAALWRPPELPGARPLPGHPGPVLTAAFSSDSRRLVTAGSAGQQGTARLWDLARNLPAASSVELPRQSRPITHVWLDSRRKALFTTTDDGALRRWRLPVDDLMDLACRTAGRNLTPQEWSHVLGEEESRSPTCPDFEKD